MVMESYIPILEFLSIRTKAEAEAETEMTWRSTIMNIKTSN